MLFGVMVQKKDDILLAKIAKRIKFLREERKITQEIFYNDTNIHIGRIEGGKINLSISTLSLICNYLEITLQEFFSEMD